MKCIWRGIYKNKKKLIKILTKSDNPMSIEELWDYTVKKEYNSLVSISGKMP